MNIGASFCLLGLVRAIVAKPVAEENAVATVSLETVSSATYRPGEVDRITFGSIALRSDGVATSQVTLTGSLSRLANGGFIGANEDPRGDLIGAHLEVAKFALGPSQAAILDICVFYQAIIDAEAPRTTYRITSSPPLQIVFDSSGKARPGRPVTLSSANAIAQSAQQNLRAWQHESDRSRLLGQLRFVVTNEKGTVKFRCLEDECTGLGTFDKRQRYHRDYSVEMFPIGGLPSQRSAKPAYVLGFTFSGDIDDPPVRSSPAVPGSELEANALLYLSRPQCLERLRKFFESHPTGARSRLSLTTKGAAVVLDSVDVSSSVHTTYQWPVEPTTFVQILKGRRQHEFELLVTTRGKKCEVRESSPSRFSSKRRDVISITFLADSLGQAQAISILFNQWMHKP